jgi:hypothetical protein
MQTAGVDILPVSRWQDAIASRNVLPGGSIGNIVKRARQ